MSMKLLKRWLLYLFLGVIWTYFALWAAAFSILLESHVLSILLYPVYFTLMIGSMVSYFLNFQTGSFENLELFFGHTPTFLINASIIALIHHFLIKRKKAKK